MLSGCVPNHDVCSRTLRATGSERESDPPNPNQRKPLKRLDVNAKRRKLGLTAFCVNQYGGSFRASYLSSSGRTRTYDPAVNSRLLYQLSYRGIGLVIVFYRGKCGKVSWRWRGPIVRRFGLIVAIESAGSDFCGGQPRHRRSEAIGSPCGTVSSTCCRGAGLPRASREPPVRFRRE